MNATSTISILGRVNADGNRGCSTGNDSGGGGAGGVIVILGNTINLSGTTRISAMGGLGGDSQDKNLSEYPECIGTQLSGVCDDCGGGGGGGFVCSFSFHSFLPKLTSNFFKRFTLKGFQEISINLEKLMYLM